MAALMRVTRAQKRPRPQGKADSRLARNFDLLRLGPARDLASNGYLVFDAADRTALSPFESEILQQRQFEDALSRENGTDQRGLR